MMDGAAQVKPQNATRPLELKQLIPPVRFTAMLVVTPLGYVSIAQVACALLAIMATGVAVPLVSSIRRKQRIAKALEPIPGPKGAFLLGILPELFKNLYRLHEFQVRTLLACLIGLLWRSLDPIDRVQEELMVRYGGRVNQPWNIFSTNSVFVSSSSRIIRVQHHRSERHMLTLVVRTTCRCRTRKT